MLEHSKHEDDMWDAPRMSSTSMSLGNLTLLDSMDCRNENLLIRKARRCLVAIRCRLGGDCPSGCGSSCSTSAGALSTALSLATLADVRLLLVKMQVRSNPSYAAISSSCMEAFATLSKPGVVRVPFHTLHLLCWI